MAQSLVCGPRALTCRLQPSTSNGAKRLHNFPMNNGRRTSVQAAGMNGCRPLVGYPAPDFEVDAVYDQEFVNVKLSDYAAFSDRYEEFKSLNCEVLGASCDSKFSHLAWIQTDRKSGGLGDLEYPLISDIRRTMASDYNVLIEEEGHPHRGLFIIDKEGIIQHATINNNPIGRNVDEVLRTLKALQHVQSNPDEVCPAGWEEGDDTINPDPSKKLDFFAKVA